LAICWCRIVAEGFSLKRFLPRGLFGRALIIIVAPIVLLQAIIAYVFFERDLDTTTRRLARDVAADIALLVALEDEHQGEQRLALRKLSERQLAYRIRFLPGQNLPRFHGQPVSTIDVALDDILEQRIGADRDFRTERIDNDFEIQVDVHDGVLSVLVPRDRITVSKPDLFILWMVGSAFLLMGIAIIFLRNQVRPIERLALAADSFGKGRAVPDFKPYGAAEVRRAAQAFITMRERIERHVSQRTEMLAGVSHDLKTPLTRLKADLGHDAGRCRHQFDAHGYCRDGAYAGRLSGLCPGRRRRGCQPHRSGRIGARGGRGRRAGAPQGTDPHHRSRSCPGQRPARRLAAGAGQFDRQCPQARFQGSRRFAPGRTSGRDRGGR
jgi:HAMP domain-containing protein